MKMYDWFYSLGSEKRQEVHQDLQRDEVSD